MCDMAACFGRLKKEFRMKNFFLQYNRPQMCVQFQFGHQRLYLIWRTFWALYHVSWIITSGVRADLWAGSDGNQYKKWFIYLTHWSYTILTLSTLVDATVVLYVFAKRSDIRLGSADSMPWYMRTNWCVFNMANTLSVTVSIAYWPLVYSGKRLTSVNISFHLANGLYVITNVLMTGMPTRLLHFWFSVIVGIVYSLFTLFYHLAGGTNHHNSPYVYSALDWRKPGTAIMFCVLLTFIGVPVVHFIIYTIHSLKVILVERCKRRGHIVYDDT